MEEAYIYLELEHLIMGKGFSLGESVYLYKSTNLTTGMTYCVSESSVVDVTWSNRKHTGNFCSP
jgi:hypothetical protein